MAKNKRALFLIIGGVIGIVIGIFGGMLAVGQQRWLLTGVFALLLMAGLISIGLGFEE